MGTDDWQSNLPASPHLQSYIDDLRTRYSDLGAEIRALQEEEDRLRHSLAQEVRHRNQLRESATRSSGDSASVQALSSPQIIAADETVGRLRDELRTVQERLVGAERERDRLREQVASLEEINTTTQDLVDLHYERAEFERRRYEQSSEQVRALQARVVELEQQLSAQPAAGGAEADPSDRVGWTQRVFRAKRDR